MPKQSAGILLYRHRDENLEVFLVHPGGPFFMRKDLGAWSVPKGEFENDEDPLTAAKREFQEETGHAIDGKFVELQSVRLKSGKQIYCWAVEGDIDADTIVSNVFQIELPKGSGKMISFPEVDRAAWFDIETAKQKANVAQVALITQLEDLLK
ncbi:NUDIX domain-containing protein [Mucilaginibacter sp. RS28]|uniref:NUDIX domain-containing protein n=1 Tax=Mucilaginibacter straminoryzae TaxID=2932774 RepID=A0A9X1X3C2_9SPHI|nr:NUDIX domain-containing protein [Mucilaginibacter straminoryzae]MCJ8208873.1 NUDIX domain-containing protein [Mucilaginibacter straminoryzae]